ncbi:ornithine decarboxylase [Xenorhabdus hominickii]|uniref:Ornithine decarboxylase n=1 Tax=Xenorhabdus hominickii TaxID=351679 RepID=A0ABN4SCU3_XENHO|nr:ornithine decarboxylase [Xenorhabdus hominickii]AOM42870.1 ornithine decarboxylase [Xenorhabdus hominickii]
MKKFNIACSNNTCDIFNSERETINIKETHFIDVSAIVISLEDALNGELERIEETQYPIPIYLVLPKNETLPVRLLSRITGVFQSEKGHENFYGQQLDTTAEKYEKSLLPPFFGAMTEYVAQGNIAFDCPGHQGGQFFRNHPCGIQFFNYFGETLFRSDLCNADVYMGDLLIHEGAPCDAQKNAAKIFNADKTYFVLNGTSSSNRVVLNALLTPGDLVLFDRNNHKSNHVGALIQSGATPIYLETTRNLFGLIGGIDSHCFEEAYLRNLIQEVAPERTTEKRPFRLAVIQLVTYDGVVYNAKQVVDKIGHLCDYILFDSAWLGYEQFIPMMADGSPLLLDLNENDPGIIVTQSVHKQQAGLSQSSQIHKKDRHIKGQSRYVNHKRFNNSFTAHASTSPFYPLFAALDVNAKMHEGQNGKKMWMDCVKMSIEARKLILQQCKYIKPFISDNVDGRHWADYETDEIANDLRFFYFIPGEKWHSFDGYSEQQYFVDPCKLLLITPGVNANTGEYDKFGVPATVLAYFLRENSIIPEKYALNSILFLLTPAGNTAKIGYLVSQLIHFEQLLEQDAPLETVLPSLCRNYPERYRGQTIRQLCQEMHSLAINRNIKQLQKEIFRKSHFPKIAMPPQKANIELVRGNVELVALRDIEGLIAADGAVPYPPGVCCIVPGEIWGDSVLRYFLALEENINQFPGFEQELQGVYLQKEEDGYTRIYGYIIKSDDYNPQRSNLKDKEDKK